MVYASPSGWDGANEARTSETPIAATRTLPKKATMSAATPWLPCPAPTMELAQRRAFTARSAKLATAMAVPADMAATAPIPAQAIPVIDAKTKTSTAPLQGRSPIDRISPSAVLRPLTCCSCAAEGACE